MNLRSVKYQHHPRMVVYITLWNRVEKNYLFSAKKSEWIWVISVSRSCSKNIRRTNSVKKKVIKYLEIEFWKGTFRSDLNYFYTNNSVLWFYLLNFWFEYGSILVMSDQFKWILLPTSSLQTLILWKQIEISNWQIRL